MDEVKDNRLRAGLICLLIYQGILVLVSLSFAVVIFIEMCGDLHGSLGSVDVSTIANLILYFTLGGLEVLGPASWGAAMVFASVGMIKRSPLGFLVGMRCHLIVTILSTIGLCGFCCLGVLSFNPRNEERGFASMLLLFALMWLPTLLVSGWGFFYLRRLRKNFL